MNTSDFYYDLPQELIAQTPLKERDSSRLLVLNKSNGEIEHKHFYNIVDYLKPGDCLVLNDSRVYPARLFGVRRTGGVSEVFLLNDMGNNRWECLCRPGKKMHIGTEVVFGNGELVATVEDIKDDGNRIMRLKFEGILMEILDRLGEMPLPPYIKQKLEDPGRYQTVYAKEPGSAAAPTAGLHFTNDLLGKIKALGVDIHFVTLNVGLGTFRPVKVDKIENHEMHSEYCSVSNDTAEAINKAKKNGNRVIAVGTTTCRTLESFAKEDGTICASGGWTNIFIYPGYKFKCIDAMITNFHLPESTLIMLVSALAGRENILKAYNIAVQEKYRFFSFGDAMFIH